MKKCEDLVQSKKESSAANLKCIFGSLDFLQENGYEVERLIGSGSVMLALKNCTKDQVAIKHFYVKTEEHLIGYIQQFYRLSLLKSPYTVNRLELLSDIKNEYLYFVIEYLSNGNLG